MFHKDELDQWIRQLAAQLTEPCEVYLIGGGAMSFRGLKLATKDIDLIVSSKEEFERLDRALSSAGFSRPTDLSGFYLTAMSVFERGESRIDIFVGQVGKMLRLTPAMKRRAMLLRSHGSLTVFLCAKEDIFLFKAMTSRAADVDDCAQLIRGGLNHATIFAECMDQSSENRWYFWLYEKLCEIEQKHHLPTPLKDFLEPVIKKNWKHRPRDFLKAVNEDAFNEREKS